MNKEKPAIKRKLFIFNKVSYRFKSTIVLMTAVLLINLTVLSFSLMSNYRNLKTIDVAVEALEESVEIERSIVETFLLYAPENQKPRTAEAIRSSQLQKMHNTGIKKINRHIDNLNSSTVSGRSYIFIIAVSSFCALIAFVVLVLYIQSRITGPIMVMNRYLEEILAGKKPVIRPLRKQDALQDFYQNFSQVMKKAKFSK